MSEDYNEKILEQLSQASKNSEEYKKRYKKAKRLRALLAIFIILIVLAITFLVLYLTGVLANIMDSLGLEMPEKKAEVKEKNQVTTEAQVDTATILDASATDAEEKDFDIKMSFVGDCCMATNLEDSSYGTLLWYESNAETTYFFDGVRSYFEEDDLTVANCENVFSDSTVGPRDKGEGRNFWFRSPAWFARVFSDNNIEAVTVNNNHTNDYGPECFEDTKKALDDAGVDWGFRDKVIYYEEDGYKIGVVCVSFYYYEEAEGILPYLEIAKENSDFQIIFFHGGTENVYQPEDWKIQACHMLVDNGADLILGAHPHVLQRRENYNGVDIVYSLGNFCFGGNTAPRSNRTIIYQYDLKLHKSGEEVTLVDKQENMIPCYVYTGSQNNWQPYPIGEEDQAIADRIISFMNGELDEPN